MRLKAKLEVLVSNFKSRSISQTLGAKVQCQEGNSPEHSLRRLKELNSKGSRGGRRWIGLEAARP